MSPELIAAILAPFVAWAGWVSVTLISLSRKDADAGNLKTRFGEMEERVNSSLDRFESRQNVFLKTYIDELTSLLRDSKLSK